jgi:hypothetical protein
VKIELVDSSISRKDLSVIYTINQDNVPEVGFLQKILELELLIDLSSSTYILRSNNSIEAFIILMRENNKYSSQNYAYFNSKYKSFLYIDRIAVKKLSRKKSLGSALYNEAIKQANEMKLPLCCEVNKEPFNKVSMLFHENLKFNNIGSKVFTKGKKEVFYLEKKVG